MTFCDTHIKAIKIPSKIKKIGKSAFFNCNKLTEIEIKSDSELKIIEKKAFELTEIKKLHIPKNVVDLQKGWCMMIDDLNDIDIDLENHRYKKYEDNLIIGKSSLINDYYDVLVLCTRNAQRVIVPSFIKIIASYAFNLCNKLKSIEFTSDSQIETIEKMAILFIKSGKFPELELEFTEDLPSFFFFKASISILYFLANSKISGFPPSFMNSLN